MKKDDDLINENSINDLIRYSEDEESDTSDIYEEQTDTEETDDFDDFPETEEIISGTEEIISETEENLNDEQTEEESNLYTSEKKDAEYDDYYDDGGETVFSGDRKNSRKGIIIGVIIGIIAIIAFVSIDSGIIGSYKSNFANNFSKIFANFTSDNKQAAVKETPKPDEKYNTEVKSSKVISLDDVSGAKFAPYKDGVICAVMNHMSYIDKSGNVIWEEDTAIVDPILAAEGNYVMLAEKNRNKICLYSDKDLVYDVDDPDAIMTAKVSASGDVAAVTNKSSYKGGISVYNKSGDQIYSWSSGSDTVISADISSASRRIAVSLLNTDSNAGSIIQFFDINEPKSYARVEAADTAVFDVKFTGDTLSVFGDNRLMTVSSEGKIIKDIPMTDVQLTHSAMDDEGNKLVSFDNGNIPMLNLYNKKGSLKESVTLTGIADFIDINEKYILYNIGRDVYFGKINSKNMTKYTATMDIKQLIITSENSFVIIYSNSFETVTL